jgi:hypothetical protein
VTDVMSDQEIADLCRATKDPTAAAQKVVSFAEQVGAEDNLTCLVRAAYIRAFVISSCTDRTASWLAEAGRNGHDPGAARVPVEASSGRIVASTSAIVLCKHWRL